MEHLASNVRICFLTLTIVIPNDAVNATPCSVFIAGMIAASTAATWVGHPHP